MAQRKWIVLGGLVVVLSLATIGVATWRLHRLPAPFRELSNEPVASDG